MSFVAAWRVNDVVMYDVMRESSTTLAALLLESSHVESSDADATTAEVADLLQTVLTVDGYDRAQVAALALRISNRIAELSGARS